MNREKQKKNQNSNNSYTNLVLLSGKKVRSANEQSVCQKFYISSFVRAFSVSGHTALF